MNIDASFLNQCNYGPITVIVILCMSSNVFSYTILYTREPGIPGCGALFVKAKNKKKQMELSYKINIADSQLLISLIPKVILMCFLLLRKSFR